MRRKDDDPVRQRRVRKGLYILPSLFTAVNIAAGYFAVFQAILGANIANEPWHYDMSALAIGFAIVFDGLDGRIARMTNTTSDFGRELDSLADVITFGMAPAILAFLWGFHAISMANQDLHLKLVRFGAVATFLFLAAGACRLARFNIQTNPQPSNPGRPGRKYFVGMPIPGGAGVVAAVVHFFKGYPIPSWWLSLIWACVVLLVGFLMVSRWRFPSFKGVDFRQRHSSRLLVVLCALVVLIIFFSEWTLFVIAIAYMLWGIFSRLFYRYSRGTPLPPSSPDQVAHAD
ncbi:MAG TPA: phosphatidylcholine/phosphatidylserine synthase [Candidatus Koribacter sp.]|jgi:CDP-diacylglycerol--serine O-phosphatidyltransferase